MKLSLALLFAAIASIVTVEASAMTCISWVPDPTNGSQMCTSWVPSTPAGWTSVPSSYAPVNGEVMLCTGDMGGGYCIKRAFPTGNTLITTGLGDYGGYNGSMFQIRTYWFKLSRDSTRYSQASLACPSCVVIPVGTYVGSGIPYVIKGFTFRN